MSNTPYLHNKDFLKRLDIESHKIQYIRIKVLNFQEQVIASIEGKATGGSINLSGTSNMRRTANCSLLVDPNGIQRQGYSQPQQYYNITEVENLISLNKKIRLETGFINTLKFLGDNNYPDYDIIWFPLGTYVIKTANVSKNNSGINISLTLNDKCALLNGDMGGTIPAATIFSEDEAYSYRGGQRQVKKILIKDIIRNLVVEFGGESPDNIIIEDIPDTIVRVMKWIGKDPVYLNQTDGSKSLRFEEPKDENVEYIKFEYGDNIGYINEPFTYPGTLECSAGESVASVLDKIKNTLGNFEWFYDIEGRFHFQEIKNYLNTSLSTKILKDLKENDYLSIANLSKSEYVFDENNKILITSISNNPQYQNIKNDFIVWGAMKTTSGTQKPIRYHLVFDNKPDLRQEQRFGFIYRNHLNVDQFVPLYLNNDDSDNAKVLTYPYGDLDPKYYYLKREWKEEVVNNE